MREEGGQQHEQQRLRGNASGGDGGDASLLLLGATPSLLHPSTLQLGGRGIGARTSAGTAGTTAGAALLLLPTAAAAPRDFGGGGLGLGRRNGFLGDSLSVSSLSGGGGGGFGRRALRSDSLSVSSLSNGGCGAGNGGRVAGLGRNDAAPRSSLSLFASAGGGFGNPSLVPPLSVPPLEQELLLSLSPSDAGGGRGGGGGRRRRLALPPALAAAADGLPPPFPQQQLAPFRRRGCYVGEQDNEFDLSPLLRLSP